MKRKVFYRRVFVCMCLLFSFSKVVAQTQEGSLLKNKSLSSVVNNSTILRSQFQIELNLGYAYQNTIMLDNQKLNNPDAFSLRLGLVYQKPILKKMYIETGLFGKFNRGKKSLDRLNFTSNNLKLQLPFYFGLIGHKKWKYALGISLENNKDFDKIDFNREDNLRYDFITKIAYKYSEKIYFSFHTNWSITNSPDIYTLNSPKNGLYLGVIYAFTRKNKKDNI